MSPINPDELNNSDLNPTAAEPRENGELGSVSLSEPEFIPDYTPKEMRRTYSAVAWLLTAMYGLIIVVVFLLGYLPIPSWMDAECASSILNTVALDLICLPACCLMMYALPRTHIPKRRMSFAFLLRVFTVCYCLMYAGAMLGNFIPNILPGDFINPLESYISNIPVWLTFVLVVLIAPVAEELLFRKFIIDRTVKYGEGTAILMSGLLFGLFHTNIYQFFYACFVGVVFAWVYVKSGRIGYSILLHMVLNLLGSVVATFVTNASETLTETAGSMLTTFYGSLILVLVVFGIVFLIRDRKSYTKLNKSQIKKPVRQALLNVGFIVFAVICTALTLISLFGWDFL